jgi:hypothetical protein
MRKTRDVCAAQFTPFTPTTEISEQMLGNYEDRDDYKLLKDKLLVAGQLGVDTAAPADSEVRTADKLAFIGGVSGTMTFHERCAVW